jgi:hypothetical protein
MPSANSDPFRRRLVLLPGAIALVLAACMGPQDTRGARQAPPPAREAPPVAAVSPPKPGVDLSWNLDQATFRSFVKSEGEREVLHGLMVTADRGWMRAASVYDRGTLIRHYDFHESGVPFTATHKDEKGDGFVQIFSDKGPHLFTGHVRANRRWNGQFLVVEFLPNTYGERQMMLHEYRDGELVRRDPFPFEKVGVQPPDDPIDPKNWPWKAIDWPDPPHANAPR